MKHKGADAEFKEERADDLMQAYNRLMNEAEEICMPEIYRKVVKQPARRFWVSEERACIVVYQIRKGDKLKDMHSTKRRMFMEIHRRAMKIQEKNPTMAMLEIVRGVVRQPAPEFYLTPGSAKVFICQARKKWYEERKKKLRFMYM